MVDVEDEGDAAGGGKRRGDGKGYIEGTCWLCSDGRTRARNNIVFCSECSHGYQYVTRRGVRVADHAASIAARCVFVLLSGAHGNMR